MRRGKQILRSVFQFLIFFSSIFYSTVVFPNPSDCLLRLSQMVKSARAHHPAELSARLSDGSSRPLLVHNQDLAGLFTKGFGPELFESVEGLLQAHESFKIRVPENGLVVAAHIDKEEGYGKAAWTRDLARVFEGLVALDRKEEARRVALGLLNMMSTPAQLERLFKNIRYPGLHMGGAGAGQVPQIRVDSETMGSMKWKDSEGNFHEELWNHKQNDAMALSFLVAYRAFQLKLIRLSDLNNAQRAYLISLPAYFKRLAFWLMHDAGAWEESEARRSSSVGLVTKVFELLDSSFQDPRLMNANDFFKIFRSSSLSVELLPTDVQAVVAQNLREEVIRSNLNHGYDILFQQLEAGEAPLDYAEGVKPRYEDAALAHLLWYPLDRLEEKHERWILDHLKNLTRETGIPRYHQDLYLFGLYYFQVYGGQDEIPSEFIAVDERINTGDLWEIYNPRHPYRAEKLFGQGLEPQWALADPILAVAYLRLYKKYRKLEDKLNFEHHSMRSWALITAEANDSPLHGSDGRPVASFIMPEAYTLLRTFDPDTREEKEKLFIPSKNTPLNWATSELAVLHAELKKYFGS